MKISTYSFLKYRYIDKLNSTLLHKTEFILIYCTYFLVKLILTAHDFAEYKKLIGLLLIHNKFLSRNNRYVLLILAALYG